MCLYIYHTHTNTHTHTSTHTHKLFTHPIHTYTHTHTKHTKHTHTRAWGKGGSNEIQAHIHRQKFSKVTSTLNLYTNDTKVLAFENSRFRFKR